LDKMESKSTNRRKRGDRKRGSSTNKGVLSSRVPRADFLLSHISAMPQSQRATMHWAAPLVIGFSPSSYTELGVYVINSCYDPDAGGGATQPAGYAKLMAFYTKCFVVASRFTLKGVLTTSAFGSGDPASAIIGITCTTNTTSLGSIPAAIEPGLTDYRVISTSPDGYEMSLGIDIARFVDKPQILDDPQFFSTVAANPAQLVCVHVFAQNYSATLTNGVVAVTEIEFDVVFTDPQPFT